MPYKHAVLLCLLTAVVIPAGISLGEGAYDGDLDVTVDGDTFSPGETIAITVEAHNVDSYPVVNGYVVLELVRGCSTPTYPSQDLSCDTVFDEITVDDINLGQQDDDTITVEYTLPEDLRSGTYRVDGYFRTDRSVVQGVPHIYLNPRYDSFEVDASGGDRPVLSIDRQDTRFRGVTDPVGAWHPDHDNFRNTEWPWIAGPVGVFVNHQVDEVPGRIVIENDADTVKNAELRLLVCGWDDTNCRDVVDNRTEPVTLDPGSNTVDVAVDAPDTPGAYAVRMAVVHDDATHSIYRNRIIARGNTGVIRFLAPSQPYYSDEEVSVRLTVGASPDHYTRPVLDDTTAHVTVTDLETDSVVLDSEQPVAELAYMENEFDTLTFTEQVSGDLRHYRVAAELRRDGTVLDEYSTEVDASAFADDIGEIELTDYHRAGDELTVELCGRSSAGVPVDADVQTLLLDGADDVTDQGTVALDGCGTYTYSPVADASYTLEVNADEQYRFTIDATDADGFGLLVSPLYVAAAFLVLIIGGLVYLKVSNQ